MKVLFLVSLNLILAVLFTVLFRKRNLLSFHESGRWWLTWLAIAFITLMDEFTSIFYAPAEAYRFIGPRAISFIYRYSMGTTEIIRYHTSRFGTLILFIILIGCFLFLAADKPYGLALWATVTTVVLTAGFLMAKKRSPEIVEIEQAESEMEAVLYLARSKEPDVQVFFQRSREMALSLPMDNEIYVPFYSPRQGIPQRLAQNHFRLPLVRMSLYHRIVAFLKVAEDELSDKQIKVQFGWPMSSWIDRITIGVMVFNLMRLPRMFPRFEFILSYHKQWPIPKRSFP